MKHHIKLILPRIKWLFKAWQRRKLFLHKKRVFKTLLDLETELTEEYIRLGRMKTYASLDESSHVAKLYTIKGKIDLINELLNGK